MSYLYNGYRYIYEKPKQNSWLPKIGWSYCLAPLLPMFDLRPLTLLTTVYGDECIYNGLVSMFVVSLVETDFVVFSLALCTDRQTDIHLVKSLF